jgi:hypothetical protein
VSTVATGVVLFLALHLVGLGPALLLWRRLDLPARYVGALAVAATALVSYAIFWIAFALPQARLPALTGAGLVSLAGIALACRDASVRLAIRQPAAWAPSLAAGVYALFCLWPLLAGGPPVNNRFAWPLPSDNILPAILAERVVQGQSVARPVPPLWPNGDRASERPPLQAAIVVTVGATVRSPHEYQALATLCQAQWVAAVWLLGAACGLRRRDLGLVVVACALSGYFYVNTLFTWPKLLAGALALGALAIALEPASIGRGTTRARALTVAALAALALLAHPGPIFTLVALPLCWPLLRPIVGLRVSLGTALAAVGVAALLAAPWLAYQAWLDPPTGHLLREHFADGRTGGSALAAIAGANADRPFAEHVRVRAGNLAAQLGRPWRAIWPADRPEAQSQQFRRHGASLGLLLVGLIATLAGRPRAPDAASVRAADVVRRLTASALVALVLWSLLVYPVDGALIHHGSPVTTALLFVGAAHGLTRLPGWLAVGVLAAHGAAFLLTWVLPTVGVRPL